MARQISKTIRLSGSKRARIKTVYVEHPQGRTIHRVGLSNGQAITTVTVEKAENVILGRVKRIKDAVTKEVRSIFISLTSPRLPWTEP